MNLRKYVSLVLLLFVVHTVYSNSYNYIPKVTSYDKNDYQAGRQNWDIKVDKNNVIYFANNSGLLRNIYGHWILNQLPSQKPLKAICLYQDKIWCGGNEIGYFESDKDGELHYHHLADVNGNVWSIEALDDHIYFQSNNTITIYNTQTKSILNYTFNRSVSVLTKWRGKIWTINTEKGLGSVNSDGFSLVAPFPLAKDKEVRVIFEHQQKLYIVTLEGEIFTYDQKEFQKLALPQMIDCFSAISLDNKHIYLGSILEGVVPVIEQNNHLKIQRKIQQQDGLLDNTVLAMAIDQNGNLWAGLDYGIAKIDHGSLLKTIINKGATYDILIHKDATYIATNKGLFTNTQSNNFKPINNTEGQVWALKNTSSGIYACHNKGLMKIHGNKSELIYDEAGIMDVEQLGNTPHYILSAYTGTLWVEKRGDKFHFRQNLGLWGNPKLDYDSINHCIWIHDGSSDKQVYRVEINNNECKVIKTPMRSVFPTQRGILFYDGKSLFEYHQSSFIPTDKRIIKNITGSNITTIASSPNNDIAVYVQNRELKMVEELADGSTVVHDKLLSEVNNDILTQFECLKIDHNKLFIATQRGVKIFPLDKKNRHQLIKNPVIAKIEIDHTDSKKNRAYYYPYTNKTLQLNSGSFRNITLTFSSSKDHHVEYRFRLLPYTEKWSEWSTTQKHVAYGNLKPNNYNFELQCRYNGTIEKETTLPIVIDGFDFYYVRIVMILVLLIFITLISLQYIKHKRLTRQHQEYKKRTTEAQVVTQKEQLLEFTEVIKNKNTFMVDLRNALIKMKSSSATQWANKIDTEINREKKEFAFHKIFADGHHDFIQRISSEFTNLTPYDIRLILFIRINANTNEIAQFLNISPNSVDTARYRLRKKLNLEHAQNLYKFIREY
ncbi:hypothetical protein K5X82_17000 [Halosquirtibacter xylanolyticus]|uniref:hypothetical protein n=1 Tax=Halosquirtibacter xylanolyticus TaxID=3374599 RepID=UPI003748A9A2|nr:hypothetical protein K5X82_17000 [Prolixibacteraceae bacterium]